ncbi:hypothetical protein [Sorangium sp. So ce861]|uniref:hypothetical protein n=1 Tax=Sorangium sp. So ce861 TaxID=3133323 RepID=UPI003F61977C
MDRRGFVPVCTSRRKIRKGRRTRPTRSTETRCCPTPSSTSSRRARKRGCRVSEYWLQFARTDTPSCEGSPAWEPHEEGQDRTLLLGETIELKTGFVPTKHMNAFLGTRAVWNGWMALLP